LKFGNRDPPSVVGSKKTGAHAVNFSQPDLDWNRYNRPWI